ncbi:N-acetylglucosamine kinase [Rhodopirellula sp. MGV]|uniref:N-acetylglucosamine kinase n=1 Tax=Rhodopirellula sp. MGV TaxID=2023130 RepID=UPI000B965FD1|nr:BadF/BadG/BcrA/BcrD ATPase family protein [Rhodopirellula sp. MGV]OYP36736.1 hypothetical protein CGZ80_07490 [Rhodopirellula sp. MGV]PNY34429.1 N-acetylglucosamine kinase [Rhodopirellula baltica]
MFSKHLSVNYLSANHPTLIAGVDAGGSKTVSWVGHCNRSENGPVVPIGAGISDAGNPRVVGFETAANAICRSVRLAVRQASEDRTLQADEPERICIGAAGAGRKPEQDELKALIERQFPRSRVFVTDDALPVLAAATPSLSGIVLISGTGSFAWGRNQAGECSRAGGWGSLIGDPGSGFAIAVAGLDAVARAADGRGEATVLVESFCEHFGVTEPLELIEKIYGPEGTRKAIAALSRRVVNAAEDGDPVSIRIVDHAVSELANHVATLNERLDLPAGATLAMTGGILVNETRCREQLIAAIEPMGLSPLVVQDPVAGALRLAALPSKEIPNIDLSK